MSNGAAMKMKSTGLWTLYENQLVKHPLITKCVTGGFIGFSADIICQVNFVDNSIKAQEKQGAYWMSIDWLRTLKFTMMGAWFTSPILHVWYGFLARRIPGTDLWATVLRLSLDQLVFAPMFIPSFFAVTLMMDGTPEKVVPKIKAEWFSTVIANYVVWVPAQFINFKFTPPHLQVLFSNMVGFFWNIYISYVTFDEMGSGSAKSQSTEKKNNWFTESKTDDDYQSIASSTSDSDMVSKSVVNNERIKYAQLLDEKEVEIRRLQQEIENIQMIKEVDILSRAEEIIREILTERSSPIKDKDKDKDKFYEGLELPSTDAKESVEDLFTGTGKKRKKQTPLYFVFVCLFLVYPNIYIT